jgi:diguanylate cyclase (GGDEF)-like protein
MAQEPSPRTARPEGRQARAPARHLGPLVCGVAVLLAAACGAGAALLVRSGEVLWAAAAAGAACALIVPLVAVLLQRFALGGAPDEWLLRATQDELTGVHNRRHFMALAERELARCRRYQTAGALLLVDADHFKRINDEHGRGCGDALLREITRVTQQSLRQPDVLARFGGEELIVFLPHTDPLGALDVADRIRERVSEIKLGWQGAEVRATVSIGVASLGPGHASLDALIHDANTALFAAKEAGRNCVRAAPIQPRRSSGERPPVPTRRH